jgi:hypothetical protein
MNPFLLAHGYDPGPTQRPALAGCLSGVLATIPAILTLSVFGSLEAEARILGLSVLMTIIAGAAVMALAGVVYGRVFQRAANDVHGGWLFGMAYGFFLWAAGAVMVLPAVSGGAAPGGTAAIGIFLSLLIWGTGLGASFPHVHRTIHVRPNQGSLAVEGIVGPAAAASRSDRRPGRLL